MSSTTFDCVRNNLEEFLSSKDKLEETLSAFGSLITDDQRILAAYSYLLEAELFPLCTTVIESKSVELSEKYRVQGNLSFLNKNDMKALEEYTLAVGYAPNDSRELALAYANRSAVTCSLEHYKECIDDITNSLNCNYPEQLKYKLWERRGKSLLKLGHHKLAEESLMMAVRFIPKGSLSKAKEPKIYDDINSLLAECKISEREEEGCWECERPCLKGGRHKSIESASPLLDIAYSEELGRHIVAAADIQPGDILAIEKPFASVLLPSSYLTHCFMCQKRSHSLLPCRHCPKVFYCSKECTEKSWDLCHKIECRVLPTLLSMGCNKMELLAVRILLTVTKQGSNLTDLASRLEEIDKVESLSSRGFKNGYYSSSDYLATHHLETNSKNREPSDLLRRALTAICIFEAISNSTDFLESAGNQNSEQTKVSVMLPIFDTVKITKKWQKILACGLLLRYLQSMPCNAHEVSEMLMVYKGKEFETQSNEIGGAVYPLLSLTNHSCDPNVVRHSYDGDTVILRALQVINCGEQIFDNYGYHHAVHDFCYRRTCLQNQYYFYCECTPCIEDWPLYPNLPEKNPEYYPGADIEKIEQSREMFKQVLKKVLKGEIRGTLPFLYSHLTLLHKSFKRPWKEYSECQETIKQCLCLYSNHYKTSIKCSKIT